MRYTHHGIGHPTALREMVRDCADMELTDSLEPVEYSDDGDLESEIGREVFDRRGGEETHDNEEDEDTSDQECDDGDDDESVSDLDDGEMDDGEGDEDEDEEDDMSF